MLPSKDISVIVQGAIYPTLTPRCLQSIRTYLPDAEIILSTWEGSALEGLDYDCVVCSPDPGSVLHDLVYFTANNTNRQLVSTQAGLGKAQRPYTLKIRTDFELRSADFLLHWDTFPRRNTSYAFFERRVLCDVVYSKMSSSQTYRPLPFHPSDFWFFGFTSDIKAYFSGTPLLSTEELSGWQVKYPHKIPYKHAFFRYAPEQFFCFSWVKKHYPDARFADWSDWDEVNIELSSNVLFNNFIFLDYKKSGIFSIKHSHAPRKQLMIHTLITYNFFKYMYELYSVPEDENRAHLKSIYRLQQKNFIHIQCFLHPLRLLLQWGYRPLHILHHLLAIRLLKKGRRNTKKN